MRPVATSSEQRGGWRDVLAEAIGDLILRSTEPAMEQNLDRLRLGGWRPGSASIERLPDVPAALKPGVSGYAVGSSIRESCAGACLAASCDAARRHPFEEAAERRNGHRGPGRSSQTLSSLNGSPSRKIEAAGVANPCRPRAVLALPPCRLPELRDLLHRLDVTRL